MVGFFWSMGDFGGVFCNRGENESERNDLDRNLPIYLSRPSTLVSLSSSSSSSSSSFWIKRIDF